MSNLKEAVDAAAARADVRQAVEAVYRLLEAETAAVKPVCIVSGRCCRFETYGHRLYVTTMELAGFVHGLSGLTRPARSAGWDGTGCVFQSGGRCGVHSLRPFGCRIFFCDAASTAWQHDAYERLHGRLRRLHEELEVPYHYVEWRYALRALDLS